MSDVHHMYDVVVVGGGISGTCCALGCAQQGHDVVVLSSSLDVVGLPGYGPVMGPVPADCLQLLRGLPQGVGRAWRTELLREPRSGVAVVDPRRLSLRLKWELELVDRVDIRQGLVVAVEEVKVAGSRGSGVKVRTALEEEFEARACVLAPGLGLGGRSRVGGQILEGGRYGEVAADVLGDHLHRAGVRTRPSRLKVGGCYRSPDTGQQPEVGPQADLWWEGLRGAWGSPVETRELVGLQAGEDDGAAGLDCRRAAPDLAIAPPRQRRRRALLQADGRGMFPAGEALHEWYLSPGLDPAPLLRAGLIATRPPYLVEARQVAIDPHSRDRERLEGMTAVWVSGRVAGCATCWESLFSGHEVAKSVSICLTGAWNG